MVSDKNALQNKLRCADCNAVACPEIATNREDYRPSSFVAVGNAYLCPECHSVHQELMRDYAHVDSYNTVYDDDPLEDTSNVIYVDFQTKEFVTDELFRQTD